MPFIIKQEEIISKGRFLKNYLIFEPFKLKSSRI